MYKSQLDIVVSNKHEIKKLRRAEIMKCFANHSKYCYKTLTFENLNDDS